MLNLRRLRSPGFSPWRAPAELDGSPATETSPSQVSALSDGGGESRGYYGATGGEERDGGDPPADARNWPLP